MIAIFKSIRKYLPSLLFAGLALFSTGCANQPIGARPLRPNQIEKLAALARPPGDFGLAWNEQGRIEYAEHRDPAPPAFHAVLDMKDDRFDRLQHSLVEIEVNDVTVLALVDTGSPFTIIDHRLALRSRVTPLIRNISASDAREQLDVTPISGLGGSATQISAVASSIRLGSEEIRDVPVMIVNSRIGLGKMKWIGLRKIDMILGNDILSKFDTVIFDFRKPTIEIVNHPDEGEKMTFEEESVALIKTSPIPIVIGSLHGNPPLPIAIDTGSDSGLWIPASLAERLNLVDFGMDDELSYGRAFGGRTVYREIAPHALTFDNLTIRNVPITIEVQPQTSAQMPFALLGQKVLRRFRVEIDYANSRIRFRK